VRDSLKGPLREGSFTGYPERYGKALEMGDSFHRVPLLRNMKGLSFHGAFERFNAYDALPL